MYRKLFAISAIALSLSVTGCSSDDDDTMDSDTSDTEMSETDTVPEATPGEGNSVYDNIANNADLSTLKAAIDAAGLADTLDNEASAFTIFAPNNAAFLGVDAGTLASLLADPDPTELVGILTYHVLDSAVDAAAATEAAPTELETLNGAEVSLGTSDAGLTFGGANIIGANSNYDADTSVGVVHIIDAVLIP